MTEAELADGTAQWQRVHQVFHEVLSLPVTERSTFVRTADVTDAVRIAVLRLLAVHDECTGTEEMPGQSVVAAALHEIARRLELKPGDAAGEYRIERLLGEGGMGSVYLAHRPVDEGVQRVALKVVAGSSDRQRTELQLRRERMILASLDHPNIARLIDVGELTDGRPYFAMEYVDGTPITRYCDELALDIPARLDLFLAVCDAVAYAHRHMVLHCDLKPSNIFVDAAGRVRLLDFGIGKPFDPTLAAAGNQESGFFSLDCAAPEQVAGGSTTTATDVYGLGCLLYELLAGTTPLDFSGTSRVDMIERIRHEVPVLASRSLTRTTALRNVVWQRRGRTSAVQLARALRGDLETIAVVALRKLPDQRYASVDALRQDIRNVLQTRPTAVRSHEPGYRFLCFAKRHRWTLSAAVLLGSVILGLIGATVAQSHRTSEALVVAERQRDHAHGVTEFLVQAFELADPLKTRGQELRAGELLEGAARVLAQQPPADAELRANVSQTLALMFFRLSMREPAFVQLENARRAVAELPSPPVLLEANQKALEADYARLQGHFGDAMQMAESAAQLLAATPKVQDGELEIRLALIQGRNLVAAGKQLKAIEHYRSAIARLSARSDISPVSIEQLTLPMARLMNESGKQVEAGTLLEDLLTQQLRRLPEDDEAVVGTMRGLSRSFYRQARIDKAIPYLEKALASFVATYGERHDDAAMMMAHLGEMYALSGRASEGAQLLRNAISIDQTLSVGKRTIPGMLDELAKVYRDELHDLIGAEHLSRQSLALLPAESKADIAFSQRILAETLIAEGRYLEAEYYAAAALPVLLKACGEDDCQPAAFLHGDLAWIRFRMYDLDAAAGHLTPSVLRILRTKSRWPFQIRVRDHAEEVASVLRIQKPLSR